jgi:hypothetical protein
MMVAALAVSLGQPVGDLLDLLGVDRAWPDVFNALADIHRGRVEEAGRQETRRRQEEMIAKVRQRFGQ